MRIEGHGLGFRVENSRLRVDRSRVQSLGLRVEDQKFRVEG